LRTSRFLEAIREQRQVVLGRLELILQDVAFCCDCLGFCVSTRDISL